MKLKKMITAILTAAVLFAVPVGVSAFRYYLSDDLYFSEDFTDTESVWERFILGKWYFHEDGGIYGYADAKAIQTMVASYDDLMPLPPSYVYVDYDMTITLAAADDADSEDDRFVSLVYVNDNMACNGVADGRVYMSFIYDFQENCFRLTEGLCQTDPEKQLLPPVYMEICDDGTQFYTLGMTVEKNRIRCFCNGELIFDFVDGSQKYFIAEQIENPILFWQRGNFVQVSNLSVDRPGYLLEPSYYVGDATGDGKINLGDVSMMLKHIAKWKGLDVNVYAADANRDGKVTLTDASRILHYLPRG